MFEKRLNFNEIFYSESECDVLLIQPNMLQQIPEKYIDPVQLEYWNSMDQVGSLLGDLPIEPNLGLLYLASSLKSNGYKVKMLDFHLYEYVKYKKTNEFLNLEEIKQLIKINKFKAVGISAMTLNYSKAIEIAEICKELNKDCIVICGGVHFSFLPEKAMEDSQAIDAVIIGEGENAIVEIIKNISNRNLWSKIKGIVYRINGEIYKNCEFNIIENIDTIRYPDYYLWPSDVPLIPRIYTARGCTNHCDYCVASNFFCHKFRQRDINDVVKQIQFMVDEYKINEFLIGDLSFAANKNYAISFCELLMERKINIKWWCQTRPNLIDENLISIMARAGCSQIGLGIESSNDDILDSVSANKTNGIGVKNLCSLIKKYDIVIQGYFVIGLPNENMNSAMKTITFIDELLSNNYIDVTHISVLVPYPGTKLFNSPEKYSIEILDKDFSKYLMNCDLMNAGVPVVKTEALTNFQIYALWQLALSTAARNYRKKSVNRLEMFNGFDSIIEGLDFRRLHKIRNKYEKKSMNTKEYVVIND